MDRGYLGLCLFSGTNDRILECWKTRVLALGNYLCYNIIMNSERNDLTQKALSIVEGSKLPKQDKELLLGRLPYAPSMVIQLFVQVCEEDPFSIDALVVNLKKKMDAEGNLQKIHEIMKQERAELEHALAN